MGVPSAAHNARTPTERSEQAHQKGAHKRRRRSLLCRRQEGPNTPVPNSWPAPSPGVQDPGSGGILHGSLTSSPIHHLFGAPLGHGLHGKLLRCRLGWGVDGGVLKPVPPVVPCASRGVRSSLHGRSQPAIALRFREGSAALGPCARDSRMQYGCSPQLPPSSRKSPRHPRRSRIRLLLRDHRSCGRARWQPETPGPGLP